MRLELVPLLLEDVDDDDLQRALAGMHAAGADAVSAIAYPLASMATVVATVPERTAARFRHLADLTDNFMGGVEGEGE